MKELERFRGQVRGYRRDVGRLQEELAREIGLHPNVLSHRLNGHPGAVLTTRDVIAIVTALASWDALTERAQAQKLLDLMDVPEHAISTEAWSTPPLSTLDRSSSSPVPTATRSQLGSGVAHGAQASAIRQNPLPNPTTPLIGRVVERAAVRAALDASRLVTLTGVGGTGKTRLALQVAAEIVDQYADGVALLDLAPVRDPALVPGALIRALGLGERSALPAEERLSAALTPAHLLLVVDNVEHIVEEAPLFARLLAAAPRLQILATSRIPLHLYGEHEVHVPPLTLPTADSATATDFVESEAVQLFIQRARAAQSDFTPQGETLATVAAICIALDGLPLAIELAAARIKLFTPGTLLSRLHERLSLLIGGPRDLPARQQTFRAALDWSYALLETDARRLLARLGVFSGSIDPEVAAAVCGEGSDSGATMEQLATLQDCSLLEVIAGSSPRRFRLLQTVREYALARLAESGEADRVSAAHARYFLQLAEASEVEFRGPEHGRWMSQLEAEVENLRAALLWYREQGAMRDELRLSLALSQFWYFGGYWREARRWLEEGLARAGSAPSDLRVRAVQSLGGILNELGDVDRSESLLQEALALSRELGDARTTIRSLNSLGGLAIRRGHYDLAISDFAEALRHCQELGDRRWSGTVLKNLANATRHSGCMATARHYYKEALAAHRETRNEEGIATTLLDLGSMALDEDDLMEAEARLTESLGMSRELNLKLWTAYALWRLGGVAVRRQEFDHARSYLHEGLTLARDVGDSFLVLGLLGDVIALMRATGNLEPSVRLMGAQASLRQTLGMPVPPMHRDEDGDALERARALLGDEAFFRIRKEGESLSIEEAIADALTCTERV